MSDLGTKDLDDHGNSQWLTGHDTLLNHGEASVWILCPPKRNNTMLLVLPPRQSMCHGPCNQGGNVATDTPFTNQLPAEGWTLIHCNNMGTISLIWTQYSTHVPTHRHQTPLYMRPCWGTRHQFQICPNTLNFHQCTYKRSAWIGIHGDVSCTWQIKWKNQHSHLRGRCWSKHPHGHT